MCPRSIRKTTKNHVSMRSMKANFHPRKIMTRPLKLEALPLESPCPVLGKWPLPEIELTPRRQRAIRRNGLVTARDGLQKAQTNATRKSQRSTGQKPQVGNQKGKSQRSKATSMSKVEGQKSKVGGCKSKVESQRSKVEGQRSKASAMSKVEGQKPKFENQVEREKHVLTFEHRTCHVPRLTHPGRC